MICEIGTRMFHFHCGTSELIHFILQRAEVKSAISDNGRIVPNANSKRNLAANADSTHDIAITDVMHSLDKDTCTAFCRITGLTKIIRHVTSNVST